MISFIPRVGKVQTGQSSGGFTAIIPNNNKNLHGTRVHGAQVPKRHYRSLKCHYRFLKTPLQGSKKKKLTRF